MFCDFLKLSMKLLDSYKCLLYAEGENIFAVQFRIVFHEEDETKYKQKEKVENTGERIHCGIEKENQASKRCIK